MKNRPMVLTLAGFDPSNGAGTIADAKTLEQIGVYGLSVITANTVQSDNELVACYWVPIGVMEQQIQLLFKRFSIEYVKIGIIENFSILKQIIRLLKNENPEVKIILDPILKSSSDFTFHKSDQHELNELLASIFLITPNYNEIRELYPTLNLEESIKALQSQTNVFLKGGHRTEQKGVDELYFANGRIATFYPSPGGYYEKHGSGCILSSAITGYLSLGYTLEEACKHGKIYVENILKSNPSLLGYHS